MESIINQKQKFITTKEDKLNHGIGLEIHEGPNVSFKSPKLFVPGNVITNEPGIYLPGIGGVRIEDDLLITTTGNRILTHSPKELIIL